MPRPRRRARPGEPPPGERREGFDLAERARTLADFPLPAAAGTEIFADCDQHFTEGLELVIDGIAARPAAG